MDEHPTKKGNVQIKEDRRYLFMLGRPYGYIISLGKLQYFMIPSEVRLRIGRTHCLRSKKHWIHYYKCKDNGFI